MFHTNLADPDLLDVRQHILVAMKRRKSYSHDQSSLEATSSGDLEAIVELETLAAEGLDSGDPIEVGPDYWEGKHDQLDERLKRTTPDSR